VSATRCPCLSGLTYDECCGLLHHGVAAAPTAESLMRSRFSAFALGDADYLLRSWHPSTRPPTLALDDGVHWYRLDIIGSSLGGPGDAKGTVEFRAFYRAADGSGSQHEVSRFARDHGRWAYLDAIG